MHTFDTNHQQRCFLHLLQLLHGFQQSHSFHHQDQPELKELLIKNLPSKIKAGNEKHLSNIYEYQTVKALDKCKFINFNSDKQISFMVFDIDKYEDKTAKEYFKNINGFYEYISEKIGLEPTYILETQKGFHFAYHLKNHVFTKQQKALNYLNLIKIGIIPQNVKTTFSKSLFS